MSSDLAQNVEFVIFDMDGLLSRFTSSFVRLRADGPSRFREDLHCRHKSARSPISSKFCSRSSDKILGRYGFNMTWDIKAGVMGKPAIPAAEFIFSHFPGLEQQLTVKEYLRESSEMQAEYFKTVEPLRGALTLVRGLHDSGVPIALASGSSLANFKVKSSHLSHIFSLFPPASVLTADSPLVPPGRGKPFPDIYLAAARSLGRDVGTPEECSEAQKAERAKGIIFEDAVPGVHAGVAAGMNVIWVPDPQLRAVLPNDDYGAKQVLGSLEEFDPTAWGMKPIR